MSSSGRTGTRWTLQQYEAYQKKRLGKLGQPSTPEASSLPPPKFLQPSGHSSIVCVSKVKVDLNKTEKRFLLLLKEKGYRDIRTQDLTLRLGPDLRYTPDFFTPENMTFWEVKGAFIREDARAKLLSAVKQYPFFGWIMAQWKDGQWTETRFST